VELSKQSTDGSEEAHVTYEVTAYRPRLDAPQVFLEQGIALAFTYGGLNPEKIVAAATGLGLLGDNALVIPAFISRIAALDAELRTLKVMDEIAYDHRVRMLFHEIYEKIRWFNPTDADVLPNVQQLPVTQTPSRTLEAPSALEDL
jgi:hypothetical protein